MKVVIIGTGYVGLTTGVCLAHVGHEVICVEKDPVIATRLNSGTLTFYEPDLQPIFINVLSDNSLTIKNRLEPGCFNAELVLIAVGTPSGPSGEIDLSCIEQAGKDIGQNIQNNGSDIALVIKSTVLPGTTEKVFRNAVESTLSFDTAGCQIGFGMNPEFLREGSAVADFLHADRIVIGADDAISRAKLLKLYESWDCQKILVDTKTAELSKYANNLMLALQISAFNQLANLCGKIGDINPLDIYKIVRSDGRWSIGEEAAGIGAYLKPGWGYGGSCFPKDISALIYFSRQLDYPLTIFEDVENVNRCQPAEILSSTLCLSGHSSWESVRVTLLGLSFKPFTDDVRCSPALPIIQYLSKRGAIISAYDPVANGSFQRIYPDESSKVTFESSAMDAVGSASIVLIVTSWPEFSSPELHSILANRLVVDPRGVRSR